MKLEPLNEKIHTLIGETFKLVYFEPEDIKSAVEWLREKDQFNFIKEVMPRIKGHAIDLDDCYIFKKKDFDKAFEDVLK